MYISDRLSELATRYHREARKCAQARTYLAATVMQVSALEAALLAMCFIYPEEVKKTAMYRQKKFQSKRYKFLEFKLHHLINIAYELAWFPAKQITWGKRTNLAGFAHEIRKTRNLVHPGAWARQRQPMRFNKKIYEVVYEVFDVATSWLLHRVHQSLQKKMQRERLK